MEEDRTSFSILISSDPGKISVGTLQSQLVDNIRIDLKEIGVALIWLRIGIIRELL